MGKFIDIAGQRFGRLIALKRVGTSNKGGNAIWLCLCSYEGYKTVQANDLKNGHTQSCGCLLKEVTKRRSTTHGHSSGRKVSPTYLSWRGMKNRCLNSNEPAYKNYGARGITVCERWKQFANFLEDMGKVPQGHQIDRIDNNGNYCKSNCRWTTSEKNNRNRRDNRLITHKGRTLCLSEWAEICNVNPSTLGMRLDQYR